MIWDQILWDTSDKSLKWTCGAHSDMWSASHARYSISMSWVLPFVQRICVHTAKYRYYINIGPWKWRKLLNLIRDSKNAASEYEVHQQMLTHPNQKEEP